MINLFKSLENKKTTGQYLMQHYNEAKAGQNLHKLFFICTEYPESGIQTTPGKPFNCVRFPFWDARLQIYVQKLLWRSKAQGARLCKQSTHWGKPDSKVSPTLGSQNWNSFLENNTIRFQKGLLDMFSSSRVDCGFRESPASEIYQIQSLSNLWVSKTLPPNQRISTLQRFFESGDMEFWSSFFFLKLKLQNSQSLKLGLDHGPGDLELELMNLWNSISSPESQIKTRLCI